jgi:hypothetical protein
LNQSNRWLNQSDRWSMHRIIHRSIHQLDLMNRVVIQRKTCSELKFVHLNQDWWIKLMKFQLNKSH